MSETFDLPFTASLSKEFTQNLKAKYPQSNIYYEYLDIGKLKPSNRSPQRDIIFNKYQDIPMNAVFYEGVGAFELLNLNSEFAPQAGHFLMHYAGAFEASRYKNRPYDLKVENDYGKLILNVFELSKADTIFIVVKSGQKVAFTDLQKVDSKLEKLRLKQKVELIEFTTDTDVSSRINDYEGNAAVILTPFFIQIENTEYHLAESTKSLAALIEKPTFVHWDYMVNEHVIGGYVISSKLLAQEIVTGMVDFFAKRNPSLNEANIYAQLYNAPLLEKYDIDVRSLPAKSNVINKTAGPFDLFYLEAFTTIFILAALIIGLLILALWIRLLASQRKALSESGDALLLANERLTIATRHTQIGVWEYILHNKELVWDEWMFRHHGKEIDSTTPTIQQWQQFLDNTARVQFIASVKIAIEKGMPFVLDYEIHIGQKYSRILRLHGEAILNFEGQPIRLIGTVVDVTQELLCETQLQHERKKSAHVSNAKSKFIASTSHEIRTPLNVIVGSAELLENSSLSLHQQNSLSHIKASATSLMHMVNNILDLARIETGRLTIQKYSFDLQAFIQRVLASFNDELSRKALDIKLIDSPNLPAYVYSDPERIKQILSNLISNAIKYTDLGSIEVALSWQLDSPDSPYYKDSIREENQSGFLSFSVTDTGIGISAEQQAMVFDEFEQSNAQTYEQYSGSGLGLHVSQEIAKLLQGSITLDSRLKEGSCFVFSLPVTAAQPLNKTRVKAGPLVAPNLIGKRVLIVDDVDINRVIIARMLADSKAEIVFAENGLDAVQKSHQQQFDLILMDILMPVMDGLAASRAIRSDTSSSNNQVIIISFTTNAVEGDEQICLDAGMNAYLAKPVDRAALFETIEKWVN